MSDYLLKALSKNKSFRAYAVNATETIKEAQKRHDTWSASTAALGRVMLGTLLLGANLKGKDETTVKFIGNGQGGQIVAMADATGHVKGYIQNPQVDMKYNATGMPAVKETVGNGGTMQVIKDLKLKEPYMGEVPFVSGEVGDEFTFYMTSSEQTPSAFGLNVHLDQEDKVELAAAFMLQVMPGATDEAISEIEQRINAMHSIPEIMADGNPENLALFGEGEYEVLEKMPVEFFCDCSKEKFARGIISLGREEIQAMIDEDQGAEVVCQFCNNRYDYSKEDLEDLFREAK